MKTYINFLGENISIGGISISKDFYNELYDDNYGVSEQELNTYLNILNEYQIRGGEIHRIIFSNNKPNIIDIGYSWTHKNNNWKNYLQSIIDHNYEMGKINGGENIWLIKAITPPNNVAILSSLEQFNNNPEEEEITIKNDKVIKIIDIIKQ